MELRFSAAAEDYENAYRSAPREEQMWSTLHFLLTFVPLFAAGIVLVNAGSSVAGGLCMGLSIAIAFAGYEVPRARRRRQFRTSPFSSAERVLTISETGIAVASPNATAQYGWQAFARYRETDFSFLLLSSPYIIGLWIPKRVMSPEQIEELRRILKARLPAR